MKFLKLLSVFLLVLIFSGCSVTKYQKKGIVKPASFDTEVDFTTVKTVPLIPCTINGTPKNFLFDTGAQFSIIQRDSVMGASVSISGASNRSIDAGSEVVESFKIGEVEFKGTFATNTDMVGLKEQIPNFGGLIGTPIINKANWLIDYPKKKLRISNQNLANDTFKTIKIKRKKGSSYTNISINGVEHEVIIDFGSSSEFSLPQGSKLAKQLLAQYTFEDKERDKYTIGGLQTITEKVGTLPIVKLGSLEFKDVSVKINVQSQPRIGISFFKEYIIYIDNQNKTYKVKS